MNDSIEAVLASKNAEMEMLFQQLNEIEESLTMVTSKYADVSKLKDKTGEVNADTRSRITAQIQDINEILNTNKQKVDQLNSQLKKSGKNNKELTAFIEKLQSRITEQEEEIQLLTTELQKKQIVIENLNKNLDEANKKIETYEQDINQKANQLLVTDKLVQAMQLIDTGRPTAAKEILDQIDKETLTENQKYIYNKLMIQGGY